MNSDMNLWYSLPGCFQKKDNALAKMCLMTMRMLSDLMHGTGTFPWIISSGWWK